MWTQSSRTAARCSGATLAGKEKAKNWDSFTWPALKSLPPTPPTAIMTIQRVPDRVLKDAYSFTVHQA